jgi:threonine dehydrogenase-like Zn-dependent dehydrogenase
MYHLYPSARVGRREEGNDRRVKALTWQGRRRVEVREVPDPRIERPNDAVVRITSSGICGSDLHLYEVLGPFLDPGDVLGHEPIGIVEEVGPVARERLKPGDRVVVPFGIACGRCWMCERGLYAQCETTQVRSQGKGAALFGYTRLYGSLPGAQAEYLRVPHADFGPVVVPDGPPDDRFVYLSDVLPTAWQAVVYADVPKGGSVAVFGLGPVGQMCARIARLHGAERVFAVDLVPERLAMARRHGVETFDATDADVADEIVALTDGRGPDAVIDAVGMEAHGSPVGAIAQRVAALLPEPVAAPLAERAGVDRLGALRTAIRTVRRGGTLSITGVYGGAADPLPMLELFDKGIQVRMGQCHVKRWIPEIMPLALDDADRLGTEDLATHRLPLGRGPEGYDLFQRKLDGCVKVLLEPGA